MQEGTRPSKPGHAHRSLHEFAAKGHPPICSVVLPEEGGEDLTWLTYQPDMELLAADEPVTSAAGSKGKAAKKRPAHCQQFSAPNPTQHSEQAETRPETKRKRRQLRGNKTLYSYRVFTPNRKKAGSCSHIST